MSVTRGWSGRTYPTRTIPARRWCRAGRLGPRREGGDQKHCEAPKATAGALVLAGRHCDGVELWDLSRVSRGALLADLGVAKGGSGNGAVGREQGDVLCGVGARRQEGGVAGPR